MKSNTIKTVILFFILIQCKHSYAQNLSIGPVIGQELEILTSTIGGQAEAVSYSSLTQAGVKVVIGLFADYSLNERLSAEFSFMHRETARFSYGVVDREFPLIVPQLGYSRKVFTFGEEELNLSFIPKFKLFHRRKFSVLATIGLTYSITYRTGPEPKPNDFGDRLQGATELVNEMKYLPIKNYFSSNFGLELRYGRFSIIGRYLDGLSNSITPPLDFRGNKYPFINNVSGLQFLVQYRLFNKNLKPYPIDL